jgi:predicted PurR-regulated permease PerM
VLVLLLLVLLLLVLLLLVLLPWSQVLFSEVQSLRQQVAQLSDLLQTVVPSLPPSPSSSRMLATP